MFIFSIICIVVFIFMIMRNINAQIEYSSWKKGSHGKILYMQKDDRLQMLLLRIFCVLMLILTVASFLIMVTRTGSIDESQPVQFLALALGLIYLGFFPSSSKKWVMTENGCGIYNSGQFIPWTQMITAGVQKRRKTTYVIVQVYKREDEPLKQTYHLMMIPDEDAEKIADMIREFIHTVDKMRRMKHQKEEKEEPVNKKKKAWF